MIRSGDSFEEIYHGKTDIPKEDRVFAFPPVPIREQMAYYQEAARRCFPQLFKEQQKSDRGRKDNGTSGQSVPKCLTRKEAI